MTKISEYSPTTLIIFTKSRITRMMKRKKPQKLPQLSDESEQTRFEEPPQFSETETSSENEELSAYENDGKCNGRI